MNLVIKSLVELVSITGGFIFFGLFMNFLRGSAYRNLSRLVGYSTTNLTAIVGTPVHEFGHYIIAKLFGYKINEVKWLDLSAKDGSLGYVNYSFNRLNIFQRIGCFFVGIGPLVSGSIAVGLLMVLLVPDLFHVIVNVLSKVDFTSLSIQEFMTTLLGSFKVIVYSFKEYEYITSVRFWVFIVLAASITNHMALSSADLKGCWLGIVTLFIVLLLINVSGSSFLGLFTSKVLVANYVIVYVLSLCCFISVVSTALISAFSSILCKRR